MLARIVPSPDTDPAREAASYRDVRASDTPHSQRRAVSPQLTARRRAQMKELGDVVAERHHQLRQNRS